MVKVMLSSLLCALYSKKKKKRVIKNCADSPEFDRPGDASPELNTVDQAQIKEPEREKELHIQNNLCASQLNSKIEISASSSTIQLLPLSETKSEKVIDKVVKPSESFCEICMEHKESWQMFTNSTCSHSFCDNCTSKHVETKVQDKVKIVTCPAVKCNTTLDSGACRWMFSEDILICWDESLCKSMIEESQKLYCPFRDCSIMLVNDSGSEVTETKCPVCQRTFCAQCQVPWHPEFTCHEFLKLSGKKKRGIDLMVEKIAKKNNWRKCPSCKFYVEKSQGCSHMTCRCSYEFCYRCGSKWSSKHAACKYARC
ncbi:E3 ubiquitin-protein ligase RSL1 [Daucus carota subsp. sativus]|uniref:RBR-type E3 ubiquitin transferase n=1 Tax=Daucus carota subsp. sativus TaxID=79200 RepID=A0A161ZZ35_DAUCS|nr:PREDICTED: probable E3 ubiquitin-protein ligase RNF217 isoform X1 [Daucus carota subsp. sativus]